MTTSLKQGLGMLGATAALGLLGDLLLRATPWGANVGIWVGGLVLVVAALAGWGRIRLAGEGRWLAIPILFFAGAYAWRDALPLTLLNFLALLIALGLAATRARAGQLRLAGLFDYAFALAVGGLRQLEGLAPLLFRVIPWQEIPTAGWPRHTLAAGRGLLLAVPVVVTFGGLFASADAVFQNFVAELFRWDLGEAVLHVLLFLFWAWLAGGLIRQVLLSRQPEWSLGGCPPVLSLGILEIGIVFGALDVLFLAFVAVQLRYFFGGAELVQATAHLSYAEYARRGFFELVTVAALVLPLLLGTDWVLRQDRARNRTIFRTLAVALVALLFVVMLSAVQRMLLYQSEYGLTELRLYTTAFMGWLAVVFVWLLATVLRGRREQFAFGALAAGFVAIALLDTIDPDALIVRVNTGRPRFDVRYNASLSADAVPALVEALPSLPAAERAAVAERLRQRWGSPASPDWRTWNFGRAEAARAVRGMSVFQSRGSLPDRRSRRV